MNKQQAIQLIDQLISISKLTRAEHMRLNEALQVLNKLEEPKKKEEKKK